MLTPTSLQSLQKGTTGAVNKRNKKTPVPLAKRRQRKATRCGCPFVIEHSPICQKDKEDQRIRITSCNYKHGNGCLPSKPQLIHEKRKAGAVNRALHHDQIKAIASVIGTGTKVPTATLREMMKPLFPPGHSLDCQTIFNVRLKIIKLMNNSPTDVQSLSITEAQEKDLVEVDLSP